MALLTATELKTSREAIKAGVNTVTDPEATAAIADAETIIYATLGYSIEDASTQITAYGDGDTSLRAPSRIRSVTAATEDGVAVALSTLGVRGGGWTLRRIGTRWMQDGKVVLTGTFGYTAADRVWQVGKIAVRKLAVSLLAGTKVGGVGAPAGAYLTGYSSESASFTYFTPTGDLTGIDEVDRLLAKIEHPFKGVRKPISVPLSGRRSIARVGE